MADARTEKVDTTLTSAELTALDMAAERHEQSRAGMVRLLLLVGLPDVLNTPAVRPIARDVELARATLALTDAAV